MLMYYTWSVVTLTLHSVTKRGYAYSMIAFNIVAVPKCLIKLNAMLFLFSKLLHRQNSSSIKKLTYKTRTKLKYAELFVFERKRKQTNGDSVCDCEAVTNKT